MKFKKIIAAAAAVLCLTLAACAKNSDSAETTAAADAETSASETAVSGDATEGTAAETAMEIPIEGDPVAFADTNISKFIDKVSAMDVYTMQLTMDQAGDKITIIMTSDGKTEAARGSDSESDMSIIHEEGLVYTFDHGEKSGMITTDDGSLASVTPSSYFGNDMGSVLDSEMHVCEKEEDGVKYTVESSYVADNKADLISYWFNGDELVKFTENYGGQIVTVTLDRLEDTPDEEVLKHPEDYEIADFTKETESDEAESESETAAETVNDSTDSSEEITAE